jgi:hypothetical protein
MNTEDQNTRRESDHFIEGIKTACQRLRKALGGVIILVLTFALLLGFVVLVVLFLKLISRR